jgi:sugar-specific transcriptional regulator TrmB
MPHNNKMLEELGLTKTEEKIYLTLVRLGESNAAELIKTTQLHRTTVYDVLDRLIEKGLAGFIIKDKIKFYSNVDPSKFLDILSEKKLELEKKEEFAKVVISKIKNLEKQINSGSTVQVFMGKKGKKTIMKDIINEGKTFLELGGEGKFEDEMPEYSKKWAEERRKKKIKAKLILRRGMDAPNWPLNEIRFLSKEHYSPASTIIYGENVVIFLEEDPSLAILIKSKILSKSYKDYFNLLWSIAKR